MHKRVLYKRGYLPPHLRCVNGKDTKYLIKEMHEGVAGAHEGARTIVWKITKVKYYWPTMYQDTEDIINKYENARRMRQYQENKLHP